MLARFLAFARGILRRRAIDAELDEELAFHVEAETRAHVARGVPAEEARRLAVLGLGGVIQTRDAVRDVRTTWLESAWREARQGVRALWAAPAFTVPAVLVVALGIGGTTAVFSVLDGVLLKPLPYPDAGELVRVWSREAAAPAEPDFECMRECRQQNMMHAVGPDVIEADCRASCTKR